MYDRERAGDMIDGRINKLLERLRQPSSYMSDSWLTEQYSALAELIQARTAMENQGLVLSDFEADELMKQLEPMMKERMFELSTIDPRKFLESDDMQKTIGEICEKLIAAKLEAAVKKTPSRIRASNSKRTTKK